MIQPGLHVDGPDVEVLRLVGRTVLDAYATAGAVLDIDLERIARLGIAACIDGSGFELGRRVCKTIRVVIFGTDDAVRADDRALSALDAEVRIPHRHLLGNVALFILCRPGRIGPVHRQCAHRQIVSLQGEHGRRDVADEFRRRVGHELVWVRVSGRGGRYLDLEQVGDRGIDGFEILLDHLFALAGIGLFRCFLDRRDRLVARHHARQREKAGLQDGVGARSETKRERDLGRIDDVQFELLDDDLFLHFARQHAPHLVRAIRAVEEQCAAFGGASERVDLEQVVELVHADEARRLDEIGRTNGFRAEAQMGDRVGTGFLGVVYEITLRMPARLGCQDLGRILVCSDCSVRTEAIEQGTHRVGGLNIEIAIDGQAGIRDVIGDADGEAVLRILLLQLVEHGLCHGRIEILRGKAVAAADDRRHRRDLSGCGGAGISREHVHIKRLALRPDFLGAIKHGDRFDALGHGGEKGIAIPRPIQPDLQHADLFARFGREPSGRFIEDFHGGADGDGDALGLRVAGVAEQLIFAAGQRAQSIHRFLHDAGHLRVERVDRLARLEEGVGIVRRPAQHRMLGRQRAGAMGAHKIVVDHRPDLLVRDDRHRILFVRRAEAVEEIDDRHARFQRRRLSHEGEIVRFLDRRRRQHRESRHAGAHHVGMVAEDRKRLGRDRARGHMENA